MTPPLPASVRSMVAHFARTTHLDRDDLAQEAALACLRVARTWRPDGAPLEVLQLKAARNACIDLVRKSRIICGAGVSYGWVELDDIASDVDMDLTLDERRTVARVREILRAYSAAEAVLVDERSADEVAAELGLTRARVYKETFAAREAVRAQLMEELICR